MTKRRMRGGTSARTFLGVLLAGAMAGPGALGAQQETRTTTTLVLPATVTLDGVEHRLAGALHVTFLVHRDNAAGVRVRAHANAQGVTVTKPTNVTCRGVGAVNVTANVGAPGSGASEGAAVTNLGLVCPGREANLRLHANLHITVADDDRVTATVANVRITPG